jgi:hypothetical protein
MADKSSLLKAAQRELKRHSWEHFVDDPPGVVRAWLSCVQKGHQHIERIHRASGERCVAGDLLDAVLGSPHEDAGAKTLP